MRVAPTIVLSEEERAQLTRSAGGRTVAVRVSQRAKMVLLAADGQQTKAIAQALGVAPATASRWRKRFLRQGVAGIEKDASRPGRKPSIPPGNGPGDRP